MALVFVDGFDSYTTDTDLTLRYDTVVDAAVTFGAAIGRFGQGGLRLNNAQKTIVKSFPNMGTTVSTDEILVGVSLKAEQLPDSGSDELMRFISTEGSVQCSLSINSAGAFTVNRGFSFSTQLGATAGGAVTGAWQRIEVEAVIEDGTDGKFVLTVDGIVLLNLTSLDTKNNSGNTEGCMSIEWRGPDGGSSSSGYILDDLVIYGTSGASPTALLGDLQIQTLRPNGVGDASDGTANGAATTWEAVDDTGGNDGDTTYSAMSSAADTDLYACSNLTGTPDTVHAVVVNLVTRSDGSDPRSIRAKVKEGTTEGDGVTKVVPAGATYEATLQDYFVTNPDTASAWSVSEVDGMQIGQEVIT